MHDLWFYVRFNRISVIQDDDRVIMKGGVQWKSVYDWKDPRLRLDLNRDR